MKKTFSFILAVSSIALLSISCSSSSSEATAPTLMKIPTITVEKDTVNSFEEFAAEITGQNDNEVRPKISGYITNVLVDEGSYVKKGQALFKLETNIQTENASSASASIEAAQANVTAAQVEVNKLIPLVEKGIISEVQLQTANAKLMQAKAQLSQARANFNSINESINFSTVRSPIEGTVGKINYREGSLVSPADPKAMTVVSDIDVVYAYFTLNEKQFINFFKEVAGENLTQKVKNTPEVELELVDGSIYEKKGKISSTTGQIDPNTGTIQFRADFKNNGLLNSGNTGKIRIPNVYENVLVVPESSTFEQQGKVYVYKVYSNDSIFNKVIEPIDRANKLVLFNEGIEEGDEIVAEGIINVRNSMKINPIATSIDSVVNIKTIY